MRCTDVEIANPSFAAVLADLNVNMAFGRIAGGYRLVVHIAVISSAIAINTNRRIGAIDLRLAAGHNKFTPSRATIRAHSATLLSSALINRQPDCTIRSHVDVTMQTVALRDPVAFVSENAWAITGAEGIAPLTCRRAERKALGAIIYCLALVHWVRQRTQRGWIGPGTDGFMIGPTTGRRGGQRHPQIAIIVTVSVNSIGADGGIRGKSAPSLLIGKQDRIETCDGREVGFIFPKRFTTLRLSWTQAFRWSQSPDRPDIHCHDPAGLRIEANIELTIAALSRGAVRREKILIARNAGRGWVGASEAGTAATAGTRQQFDGHMDAFASRRVRDDLHSILARAIGQRANACDLWIGATRGLIVGRLATVGVVDGTLINIEIVV